MWAYNEWPSGEPYEWGGARRGLASWDQFDFHVDLGCGKIKKGRIGVDKFPAPGVNVVMDLNTLTVMGLPRAPGEDASVPPGLDMRPDLMTKRALPFADSTIESIVSHHCFEHIGTGFIDLIDEVYRVLVPGGLLRAITPLFPSRSAVDDPTHVRYFTESTWEFVCGRPEPGGHWMESFSVPYMKARFEKADQDVTQPLPIDQQWTADDAREIRVALKAVKG